MSSDPPSASGRLQGIYLGALDKQSEAERAAFLDGACSGDLALRSKVEAMLKENAEDSFLETPVASLEATIEDPQIESPGTQIGRYKILQRIGEGGMGAVYMAEQTEPVVRKVALKIIKLGMDTKQVVARFEAERQALAMMDHPNIAKVLDAGSTDQGRPYFVMELVRGVPITEYCDKNKLDARARLELFIPVCQAIQHAHHKGVIHRDIKPSNVMVTLHDGRPVSKVIDFGIAKATNQRLTEKTLFTNYAQMIGTPAYMSPEQAEMSGLDVDTRTDVYSLGVLLYELLTGAPPFSSKELLSKGYGEMQRIIAEKEPDKPSTRMITMQDEQRTVVAKNRSMEISALGTAFKGDLDWIVMKALEKDRAQRYETVNGLVADVNRHLNNEPVSAAAPTFSYQLQKFYWRNRAYSRVAVGVALILALAMVLSLWQANVARSARDKAILAQEQALHESVRGDDIAVFSLELLQESVPRMFHEGNHRAAEDLIERVEAMATNALSKAPATELRLRLEIFLFYKQLFIDMEACRRQEQPIIRLMNRLSESELPLSRLEIEAILLSADLYSESGRFQRVEDTIASFESLLTKAAKRDDEQGRRVSLRCLISLGYWHFQNERFEEAESKYRRAETFLREKEAPEIRLNLVVAQSHLRMENRQIERLTELFEYRLTDVPNPSWLIVHHHGLLMRILSVALRASDRPDEFISLLKEMRSGAVSAGWPEQALQNIDAVLGKAMIMSGHQEKGLALLQGVVSNPDSDITSWESANLMLRPFGSEKVYTRSCRFGLARFAGGDDERGVAAVAYALLARPLPRTYVEAASDLIDRFEGLQQEDDRRNTFAWMPYIRAMLAFREQRFDAVLQHTQEWEALKAPSARGQAVTRRARLLPDRFLVEGLAHAALGDEVSAIQAFEEGWSGLADGYPNYLTASGEPIEKYGLEREAWEAHQAILANRAQVGSEERVE